MDELPPAPSTRSVAVDWAKPPGPPAIEGYDVGELVGRGGMAVVYKAHQRSLNRPVALKMLLVGPYFDADEARRIRAEAESIARLQHPNVVHVYEVGECDGRPYLLMEFVDGGTLADRIKQGPIAPDQAVAWAEAIARGVHAAHRRGIVHRDLKPANVLMTADGVPKITDFGIARRLDDPADRTRTGLVVGTPAYMSPEQAESRKGVGPPADIWAVGTVLYEMITGRRPFDGETSFDLLRRVASEEPPRPSRVRPGIPARLESICMRCLQKDPANRYPSAEALADDLARYRAAPARTIQPRRPWLVPAMAGAMVLVVAFVAWRLTREPEPVDATPLPLGPDFNSSVRKAGRGPKAERPPESVGGEPRWERMLIAADDDGFHQLAFPTGDVGYAVSQTRTYRTEDGGRTWSRRAERGFSKAFVLTFTDPLHGWVGADKLYHTTDGAATWTTVNLPGNDSLQDVRALALGPDGWGLAGGTSAGEPTLFRRRAGADDWERLDPATWDGADRPHRNWFVGGLAVSGKTAWATLFSAAEAGVVLHTADGGDTWKPLWTAEADLFHVHFVDTNRGWLAGSGGRLWATADGGRNWTSQTNPAGAEPVSALAFAPDGTFGIAPVSDGRILTTKDGQHWTLVNTQLRGPTPAAAVVGVTRAYVLGRDGYFARYADPRAETK
jgi:serine/threonine protein kinase/photosystem II stability/assembly factor-like uncharacterized protein